MAVKSSGEDSCDPGAEKGVSEEAARPRAKWANKMEFFLCASTQTTSYNFMWIFPFFCIHYGGAVFLIPYCVSLFFCGMPLLLLGLAMGQYTSESGVTAWKKICPMFQGIGIASMVILIYMSISSELLMPVWSLLYLYNSVKSPLPWTTCDNAWNTEMCVSRTNPASSNTSVGQRDDEWMNLTTGFYDISETAEMEFWRSINPTQTDNAWNDKFGSPLHWSLIPCLFIVWVLCYFCTWKGIKYTGKIMYMVAFPYLLLIILFIRSVTLPGAGEGLKYLFIPDFHVFSSPYIWMFSVSYSLHFATSTGVRTTLGSYNKYNNDCYRDTLILCALHVATIIFFNCIAFSFIGFVAHIEEASFNDVMRTGTDMLFVLVPKALSLVAGSSFWTVLYFFMTILFTLSHQIVLVESLATNVNDLLPRYLRKRHARELVVLAVCGLCLLVWLLIITKGGLFFLQLVDYYALSFTITYFIVCFETIVVAWVYGADRFYDNIADMIGYVPFPVLKYCWLFITPLVCAVGSICGFLSGFDVCSFQKHLSNPGVFLSY
ncbi:unnamed protein product [Tetraodon nigroviridis]|uniref:(spotted green pufferfish) hypothetical protein n=1 Tax=Tetraodon nigroviridis TaxID=99883 RepID=Q4SBR5_TETNG|nr:unnamed protein product [Tetraodon nigroviridis]